VGTSVAETWQFEVLVRGDVWGVGGVVSGAALGEVAQAPSIAMANSDIAATFRYTDTPIPLTRDDCLQAAHERA
jgi:hypothetical protein